MDEKVYCEECKCWKQVGRNLGDCKRHAPQTFEQVNACWPRTSRNDFCYEGIKKEKEVLND
jgi:hypothetical protein